jgi:DNA-binding HxlR family transcriptional regulator
MASHRSLCSATPEALRSPCPIAGALDLLGDAWTLLVLRDLLLFDKHRFAEFLDSPEGISTNILAERLKRLERYGLVERRRYQQRPPRDEYYLTVRGHDLLPVLRELVRWGQRHVRGTARRHPGGLHIAPRPRPAEASKRKTSVHAEARHK